jgi:membrane associated rhomboid family serine protease
MRPAPPWTEARRYPVVAGTFALAVAATVAWWMGVDMTVLMETQAVQRGQLWRLVTSSLLHGGIIHLGFNLFWLWVFGTLVEGAFGHARTLLILVFLSAASGAASVALAEGGVGLSGIGYGLFGMLWVLSKRDPRFAGAVDTQVVSLFVAWFFFCIGATYMGVMNVGNVAHGSGAIFGGLLGLAISSSASQRRVLGAATGVLAVVCLLGATVGRPYVNFTRTVEPDLARLGYQALLRNEDAEAAGLLIEATNRSPDDAASWHNLGIALRRLGHPHDAAIAYRRAAELDPANPTYGQAAARYGVPPPTTHPQD